MAYFLTRAARFARLGGKTSNFPGGGGGTTGQDGGGGPAVPVEVVADVPQTAARSRIVGKTASFEALQASSGRSGLVFFCEAGSLYVAAGEGNASITDYSVKLVAGETWDVDPSQMGTRFAVIQASSTDVAQMTVW